MSIRKFSRSVAVMALTVTLFGFGPLGSVAEAGSESGHKTCGGTESVNAVAYGSHHMSADVLGFNLHYKYSPNATIFHYSHPHSAGGGYWNTFASNNYSSSWSTGYCA